MKRQEPKLFAEVRFVKKVMKIIAIIMSALVIVVAVAVPSVIYYRGDCSDYMLSDEFKKSIKNADTSRSDSTGARIMTSNLLVHYESWGGSDAHKRAAMFFKVLETYKPDVVALQEMSDQWFCCIMRNKGSYKMLYPVSTGALIKMTAIIYNSDTVDLLDSGEMAYSEGDNFRLRRVVWGLFQDKKTKKQYIVSSTHLDLIREGQEKSELKVMQSQVKEEISLTGSLQKEYSCPVFAAGDFNTMDQGGYDEIYDAPSVYDKLASSLKDTKNLAKELTGGDAKKVSSPTYDHIFQLGKAKIERYSILSDSSMTAMSDHYPIFIDVAF